jgi:hypothetical protein
MKVAFTCSSNVRGNWNSEVVKNNYHLFTILLFKERTGNYTLNILKQKKENVRLQNKIRLEASHSRVI